MKCMSRTCPPIWGPGSRNATVQRNLPLPPIKEYQGFWIMKVDMLSNIIQVLLKFRKRQKDRIILQQLLVADHKIFLYTKLKLLLWLDLDLHVLFCELSAVVPNSYNLLLNFSTLNPTVGTIFAFCCSSGLKWLSRVLLPLLSRPTTNTLHSFLRRPSTDESRSRNPMFSN